MFSQIWQKCSALYERVSSSKLNKKKLIYGALVSLAVFVVTIVIVTPLISWHYNSQIQVYYSLDRRQNDKELIKVIDSADKYVYFAIYFFTKDNIAEALVRAKKRGLVVWGIMDREASYDSNKNILAKLESAGITVEKQKHPDGIMHIKALVTEKAYVSGSYNWTASATTINDEVTEIGTNEGVRKQYLEIIKKLLLTNGAESNSQSEIPIVKSSGKKATKQNLTGEVPEYDFEEAPDHIGEEAVVTGKVISVFTSKTNTTFLNYCSDYKKCSFSVVIFASDKEKFSDVQKLTGEMKIRGVIKSYQGKAEVILEEPEQIVK
ncbi:MAG: phospholipase D-like domain-containing protein [Candidatus Paceibacterota bacterium]